MGHRVLCERSGIEGDSNELKERRRFKSKILVCEGGSPTCAVEHLVHGEGLQEVGSDGVMPDFLLPVVAGGGEAGDYEVAPSFPLSFRLPPLFRPRFRQRPAPPLEYRGRRKLSTC